jgi:hypothetical protein
LTDVAVSMFVNLTRYHTKHIPNPFTVEPGQLNLVYIPTLID